MNISQKALKILGILQEAGYKAYFVGGCIRDRLIGRTLTDWDITTSARPEQVVELFEGHGYETLDIGQKYGTVTVCDNLDFYEVTTFRRDGVYADGRHPDSVEYADDIITDLARRDFTMNAIAWNPDEGFIDPFGGRQDIKAKIIRCVGDPDKRFKEDALRIFRTIRFASTLGFMIDPETLAAARANLDRLQDYVSAERKRAELYKLLEGEKARRVLLEYSDILAAVIPEIVPCIGFEQHNPYHVFNVWEHIATSVQNAGLGDERHVVHLTMLLHDIGKPYCFQMGEDGRGHFHGHGKVSAKIAKEVLTRLRFEKMTTDAVVQLIEYHDQFIEPNKKAVRRLLSKLGYIQFYRLMEVREADIEAQDLSKAQPRLDKVKLLRKMAKEIKASNNCISMKDMAVNGYDLINLGYKPGPKLGDALNKLFDKVLDHPWLNHRIPLLVMAKTMALKSKS